MKSTDDLEHFISEHYAAMKNLAVRFIGSPDIAEDIVQEIIIKYWETCDDLSIRSMDNYLYTLVKNRCLNYLISYRRENNRFGKMDESFFENKNVENRIIEQDTNQIIVDAINRLPFKTGDVIRLALSGYTNKEIAFTVGISINTVKTLKYSALKKLREYFLNRNRN